MGWFVENFTHNKKYCEENPHSLWIAPKEKWLWLIAAIILILAIDGIFNSGFAQQWKNTVMYGEYSKNTICTDTVVFSGNVPDREQKFKVDTLNTTEYRRFPQYNQCWSWYSYSFNPNPPAILWKPDALPIMSNRYNVSVRRRYLNDYTIDIW